MASGTLDGWARGAAEAAHNAANQEVMKEAATQAKAAGKKAASVASRSVKEITLYVKQGPTGISVLCVIGGLLTVVSSILGLINIFAAALSPINYLVNVYTLMFGFMIIFLEAEPERMKQSLILGRCVGITGWGRNTVLEYFKFATSLWGRGLFYIFVGSFGLIQWTFFSVIIGIWMIACGVLLVAMNCQCGVKEKAPDQYEAGGEQL